MYIDLGKVEREMQAALGALDARFQGLRTGRASTKLLEPVQVEVYGARMRLDSVASLSVLDPRTLGVSVWDRANVKAVERAIREAGLGLNPVVDGTTLRLPLPPLDEQRRKEMARAAARHAEEARVAVRGVRREWNDRIRRSKDIGDAASGSLQKKVQELTDRFVAAIDAALERKEGEILAA
jgi:ribosome recycling factor